MFGVSVELMRRQATGEEARLARKRKSVDAAEMSWLQTHLKAGKDGGAAGAPPGRGRLQAIADTIIGNLQFSITNVHIRYEVGAGFDLRLPCGCTLSVVNAVGCSHAAACCAPWWLATSPCPLLKSK